MGISPTFDSADCHADAVVGADDLSGGFCTTDGKGGENRRLSEEGTSALGHDRELFEGFGI